MKMTYIGHSGVALQWENCNWVIDYYTGKMPELEKDKRLFVFSSHSHGDHFNPEVFSIFRDFSDVIYILSFDIEKKIESGRYNLTDKQRENINYLEANRQYSFDDGSGKNIEVETFLSTDEGIAFLIKYDGKTVYHAGDLHWWAWPENEKEYDEWMKNTYLGEIEKMRGEKIDLAFVPVDERIQQNVFLGADAFMRTADVKMMYPIHMFGKFGLTKKFRENDMSLPYREKIMDIDYDGQQFNIDI